MSDKDYHFMKFLCEQYECNQTDLITELIRRGEYTELNYDDIKEFNRIFGNIGNNINQIARILNTANKNTLFTEEQYEEIKRIYDVSKQEYSKHQLGIDKVLRRIYRIKLKKHKYKIDEFDQSGEGGNITT